MLRALLIPCVIALLLVFESSAAEIASNQPSDVVTITSSTFYDLVTSEEPWLIEFYAPWCGHCKRLEPVYNQVASELKGKVRVGKVDGSDQRMLSALFPVAGYPTIFFVKGTDVYLFKGSRSVEGFLQFVNGGYENQKPLDALESPFGFVGQAKRVFIRIGLSSVKLHEYMQNELKAPWYVSAGVIATVGITCTLVISAAVAWLFTQKPKLD